jgi:hypothetical protein
MTWDLNEGKGLTKGQQAQITQLTVHYLLTILIVKVSFYSLKCKTFNIKNYTFLVSISFSNGTADHQKQGWGDVTTTDMSKYHYQIYVRLYLRSICKFVFGLLY